MDSQRTRTASAPAIDPAQRLRTSNRRTAIILSSIATVFFVGIIATKWMGGPTIGIGVMGVAVLLFLVVAIGRNLRSKR
jgi:Flp pilus assembly protein TadB